MIELLRRRREELLKLLKDTSVQVEQVRGALAFCDELIQAAEGNGLAAEVPDA